MKSRMSYLLFAAAAILGLTAIPPAAAQKLSADELDSLIANARTQEDHLKIAVHYTALADELAEKSKDHERMAVRFQRRNLPPKVAPINRSMTAHCKNLKKSLEKASRDARQMASDHEAMAKELAR
jgi:hypothetical protein